MKRFLCPRHAHQMQGKTKPITLSVDDCSMCRWGARPMTLIDLAGELENIAAAMRFAAEDENYDPFGISWAGPYETTVIEYLRMTHEDYRKSFLARLKEAFK